MDERYAYISTEMDGFVGNILVIYDMRDPKRPEEVSRWWMPGQHIAGGEKPTWSGKRHRLHHALRFGDEMWASCWHGGFRIVDIADLRAAENCGVLQLSSAVSRADAHGDAGAGQIWAASASRSRSTKKTRRKAPMRKKHAAAGRMRHVDFRRQRLRKREAAFAIRGERTRLAICPYAGRTIWRAPVSRTHGRHAVFAVWFGAGLRIIDVADPSSPRAKSAFSFRSLPAAVRRRRATMWSLTSADSFMSSIGMSALTCSNSRAQAVKP